MTVIARAPLRIGLAGGGTDLPDYADRFGGVVVSTSIDRYVYAIISEAPADVLQITAADANTIFSSRDHLFDAALFWGADYRLPTEILKHFGITGGRRIFIASEVPPGTGLGSSSATAVALITALAIDRGISMSRERAAEIACHIEIDCMGMPIGRQDQYAAALGGLNTLTFGARGTHIEPFDIADETRHQLEERVLLFFTGQRRRSTDILNQQRDATRQSGSNTLEALHVIKALAYDMRDAILAGDLNAVGDLLDKSWQHKRSLAPGVSNAEIDAWYGAARDAGALGGKITGAGGGGFLLLYAQPEHKAGIIRRMSELGLVWVDTAFDTAGATSVLPATSRDLVQAD